MADLDELSKLDFDHYQAKLEELASAGFAIADPLKMTYLQGLAKRLSLKENSHNQILINKAFAELKQSQLDFLQTRESAKQALDLIQQNQPDNYKLGCQLFADFKLSEILSMHESSNHAGRSDSNSEQQKSLLRDLIDSINTEGLQNDGLIDANSLEQTLLDQEISAVASCDSNVEQRSQIDSGLDGGQLELHSLRKFRQAIQYHDVDQLLSRAIDERPPNPGPHNPQMLAVKALTELRDLSPQYARRFTQYLETMLWLEKNTSKLLPSGPSTV